MKRSVITSKVVKAGTVLIGATTLLAACGSSSTSSATTTPSSSAGPIEIGAILPLTGSFTPLGQGNEQGLKIAQQQINAAGGIHGRKVDFIIKDDQTSATQGVVDFNALKSSVVAILGSSSSDSTQAVAPLAERDHIPYLALSPVDQLVTPAQPYIFLEPYLASLQSQRLMDYLKSKNITKLAVIYDSSDIYTTNGFHSAVAQASKAGITIVDKEAITPTVTDFTSTLTRIQASGAQAVEAWVTGAPSVILAKQFQSTGMSANTKLVMTESDATTLFTQPAGSAADGIVMTGSPANIGTSLPSGPIKSAYNTLASSFSKDYSGTPSAFTSNSWTAAQILFKALEQAPTISPAAIASAISHVSVTGTDGAYQYSSSNHSGATINDIMVLVVKNGQFAPTAFQQKQLLP